MIVGPRTSPLAMRRRSASVLACSEPVSSARTTPYDVSIPRSAVVRRSAGAVAAPLQVGWMKCTWLFQNPAVTVPPAQSITVASGGTRTSARRPTAVMTSLRRTTTPSGIGIASGAVCTRPPTSAMTVSWEVSGGSVFETPQAETRSAISDHVARCLMGSVLKCAREGL